MKSEYTFKNPTQVINMGGPWIGSLYLNECFVANGIVLDNLLYLPDNSKVFFVKYHEIPNKGNGVVFTICYWDLATKKLFESPEEFNMLYLKKFNDEGLMIVCDAFHGELPERCYAYELKLENFVLKG